MKMIRWIALAAAAALMLGLFAACKGEVEPSPTITPPSETTAPPETTPPPPPVTMEPILFPDLDGFDKDVDEASLLVTYNKENVFITLNYFPATAAQLAEASSGWGPELEAMLLGTVFMRGTVSSDSAVDLPGLGRKGLEAEIDVGEGYYCRGLVMPLEDRLIAVFGASATAVDEAARQALLDALDQLKRDLTV